MSDKCSYRGALDTQATENHKRVSQRRIDEFEPEKPVIKDVPVKRRKSNTKSTAAKSKR